MSDTKLTTLDVETAGGLKVASVAISSTPAELNQLAGVTAGTVTASKAVVVGSSKEVNEWTVTAGALVQSQTVSTAAMGTVRGIHGQVTGSHAAIASGNIVGVRGLATLSGVNSAGGAYFYGAQGKLVVTGTMNHADSRLCAVLAQLDTTGATLTAGQISALWVDHGAGITGAGGGQFNMIRITNTVSGSKPNAVIYAHSDATYLLDLSAPGGTMSWQAAAGASSGSWGNADAVATKVLIINLGGTTYYIPAHTANG
jgi:hypothetical protein